MSQPRKPKGSPNSTGGQFDTTATTTGMGLPPMPDTDATGTGTTAGHAPARGRHAHHDARPGLAA